jgi:exodeoxyribonuclease V beta subunit
MWAPPGGPAAELGAAVFDRSLDWRWRRTSYTDITAGTYAGRIGTDARVGSEPEETMVTDEPDAVVRASAGGHAPAAAEAMGGPSLLGGMPGGVQVGTLVHRVLEAVDFGAADLDGELAGAVAAAQGRGEVAIGDPGAVVAGLRAAIETPLGPGLGDLRLRDLRPGDRLDELGFELPLAGGDEPTGRLTLEAVADVLRARLPAGDALAGYAERLGDPGLRPAVGGYLNGSLDLVFRFAGPGGRARFGVVDYKTNWLGPADEELRIWHYRPEALGDEMRRSHYGLQALLYAVALHRYLRWRVGGYSAERDLAGVAYLFVRGMVGAGTPSVDGTPCGVFWWRPPAGVVEGLSDVLDGRGAG